MPHIVDLHNQLFNGKRQESLVGQFGRVGPVFAKGYAGTGRADRREFRIENVELQ
ncbi:MAG: hypothetical protein JW947_01770 [Sedimentisphaerales bacterium]|nr:hypothetical protein [Sedimentisphaerales bacterium]